MGITPRGKETVQDAIRYTCSCCGEIHEGLPDIAYDAPLYAQSRKGSEGCRLTSDFCVLDGVDFFVRGLLLLPLQGRPESFGWGVWSSLSEASFQRCQEVWALDDPGDAGPFFGWFSNRLPFYPDTLSLKVTVTLQKGGKRPLFELEPTEHPLSLDQREGISLERAIAFAEAVVHPESH